ncbi:NAD-dependent epimerase/dehydratase family protein [Coprobacter tertius]|uniref:NAD(P)-dependent oxidoreductase n=1 Tax=Coprobacter tertius TaxID=2944915 RepID=A0ABT1MJA0_9BACT|nr:NAD(P)-dependent oxidoreductase [Coprobacter tertius]MCP9612682.1 NAD(P)-dependent oxidoreductase [Coprobacter tertius]
MNKNIVVFGATGTLGTHIAVHFKNLGYRVYAVGHRSNDNGFFADYDIPYFSVDIADEAQFEKLPHENIYAVLHFAGALPASMEGYSPALYIDSIVKGTLNVLEYTRKCGAEKIVFPQSLFDISYLFGTKEPIPADAERRAPMSGDHAVYVIAKMAAVDLIEHYYHKYGIKRFILRLSRIYMFHPNPYTFTDGVKCLISDRYLIDRAMKGEKIEIWGDPDRLLETICVKDFLQIVQKSVESSLDGGIYNVGSGGSTLRQRIFDIVDVFSPDDRKSPIVYCPEKKNSQQFVLDISKTMRELGYRPQYDWKAYLLDFKKEMEEQPFKKLWGTTEDYEK